ncbi:MAG TPA: transposase [Anaerolineales bacterium]|nr:transposase [Anaerolineales bacterium]
MVSVSFTACIQARRLLFANADTVDVFLRHLWAAADRWACTVPAYCFMPDHVHVLLQGKTASSDTRRAFIHFKQSSGYWMVRNRQGFTWQKGFYDRVLRTEGALRREVRYIVENPVRKRLVVDWRDYPFTGSLEANVEDLAS